MNCVCPTTLFAMRITMERVAQNSAVPAMIPSDIIPAMQLATGFACLDGQPNTALSVSSLDE